MEPEPIVIARNLTKRFGSQTAVDHINFDIHHGEVVGFLGPNGAGKTTTIRMLLNLLNPSGGELRVFGEEFHNKRTEILQKMNSSSGSLSLPGKLSVREALIVFGDLYGIQQGKKRADELIEKFDLGSIRNKEIYALSSGQQIRASLAKSFLNHPQLLLLDEPTSSLDPEVAARIRAYITELVREEKTTVFLTSHNMREVEQMCSRVLFLNKGKIEAEGTPEKLAREVRRSLLYLKTDKEEINIELPQEDIGPFINDLVQKGHKIESISIKEPTLEEFFVHKTRK